MSTKAPQNVMIGFMQYGKGRSCYVGIHGKIVKESEKAVQVELDKNSKVKLWFPKKALIKGEKICEDVMTYKLACWFNGDDFFNRMWVMYSDVAF